MSRWASAGHASSTTSRTWTSSSSPSQPPIRCRPTWPCEWVSRSPANSCRLPTRPPPRARSGRWTPRFARRARPVPSCAPSTPTSPTTASGPKPGSSKHCSRRDRRPATWNSVLATSTPSPISWLVSRGPGQLRRRRAGDAQSASSSTYLRSRLPARSNSAGAVCATSSSRCNCCNSCTGEAMSPCDRPPPSTRSRRWRHGATSAVTTPPDR